MLNDECVKCGTAMLCDFAGNGEMRCPVCPLHARIAELEQRVDELLDMNRLLTDCSKIPELQQQVADAEWLRDEQAEAVYINFADPPDPMREPAAADEDWRWQIYNIDGDLIGDAMVRDYWEAVHLAREATESTPATAPRTEPSS